MDEVDQDLLDRCPPGHRIVALETRVGKIHDGCGLRDCTYLSGQKRDGSGIFLHGSRCATRVMSMAVPADWTED